MTSKDKRSADAAHSTRSDRLLRERAEEIVRKNAISSQEGQEPLSPQETRQTLHELRVHQIELEMQTEELRRTQVELESARARYFDRYDLAPVGYCTISERGQIKEVNFTAANLLGVTRSALVRQPFTTFILKEDRDIYYMHSKPLFETGAPQVYELRMVKKDAAPFWARLEATREQDADGTTLCRVTVSDITERKRVEEMLRESEQRFRHVSELITDFAYSCLKSPVGPFKIDWLTGAVENITEYTADEIQDMNGWSPLVVEDDLPLFDHDVAGLSPGEWARSEIRIRKKDGEIVWLASFAQCFTDQHIPAYHRIYGACRDITERKHAEQALVKKSEDLARSNADLAQFAYVASHDLQEPLRTITRFVQLLEKRYQGKLDQDADEFIGFVVGGTKRMQQIINDLLAYSRVNTRRGPPNIMKIEDAIQRAMQNIQYVLEESGGTVIYDEMPSIIADESQMTQLFQNIIGNALKFHGEEAPRVEISAVRKGDDWIFSVRDNGIGIDPQYNDRIFEIFQRLHTCEEYPGTGIGLAIAKKIVERHQGHIWVESLPGKGSTFNFTLPVDAKNA
ncbi:MAG: ATP-binding protein [Methanothrix sp.]|nr:ATP-binding protein [Methanothrix sp.]